MLFEEVGLSVRGPRDSRALRKAFHTQQGLGIFYLLGLTLLLLPLPVGVALFLSGDTPTYWPLALAFSGFSELTALWLLFYASRKSVMRMNALIDGLPVEGKVIGQGQHRPWYALKTQYTLEVAYSVNEQGRQAQIAHVSPLLHSKFPTGTLLLGMYDSSSQALSFGLEMGRRILLIPPKKSQPK